MAVVYKKCTPGGEIPSYMCDPCLVTEKGRVSGIAYIHKSLKDILDEESSTAGVKNVETKTWWETQILAGLIKMVPKTSGTYDGGTANMVTGFGRVSEYKSSKTHIVVARDPNHTGNDEFWNAMENIASDYMMAWRTETELRVSTDTLKSIDAKDAVEDDVNSDVVWEVTNTWDQRGLKKNVPIYKLGEVADVFECIDEELSKP